jgi:glycosyltransferase involved in cell wall biosynthesis
MFKDEADILPHWFNSWIEKGVEKFYLCDNGSTDGSVDIVEAYKQKADIYLMHSYRNDFPQRDIVNQLKAKALNEGFNLLFPVDADETLNLSETPFYTITDWISSRPQYKVGFWCAEYRYKNHMPNGVYWFEPEHRKVFGKFKPYYNISIGSHCIEGRPAIQENEVYLNHFQYRSWEQFRRKKITFFQSFERAGYLDHNFVKQYRLYQQHGEEYLEQMWDNLLRGVVGFEFKVPN